jgi:TRAP-type C4-dicarboxylate transport system substrate-binding protein
MRKIITGMVLAMFSVCFLFVQSMAQTQPVVLKAFTNFPLTSEQVDGFKHFIQLVNERAKGELEIKLMGGPELISVKESLGALGRGMMDMEHENNVHFAISQAADFSSSPAVAVKIWQDPDYLRMIDTYHREKANITVLGSAGNPNQFYFVTAKKPVTTLENAKGLRIRTHGGLSNVVVTALGAAPTTIPTGEVYTALERGVVDGAMRTLLALKEYGESEVVHNVVTPEVFRANAFICMNQDSWKKLPAHLQKLLKDATFDALKWGESHYAEQEKNARNELMKKGVKFNALSSDELARWRKVLSQPQRDWYLKEAGPEAKAVLGIVDKYEKSR